MPVTGYDQVARCAVAYLDARQRGRVEGTLAAADAVLQARVLLAESLVECGWTPPAQVDAALTGDRAVLLQGVGVSEQRTGSSDGLQPHGSP